MCRLCFPSKQESANFETRKIKTCSVHQLHCAFGEIQWLKAMRCQPQSWLWNKPMQELLLLLTALVRVLRQKVVCKLHKQPILPDRRWQKPVIKSLWEKVHFLLLLFIPIPKGLCTHFFEHIDIPDFMLWLIGKWQMKSPVKIWGFAWIWKE